MISYLYNHIFKPLAFRRDPEEVHDRITRLGKLLGKFAFERFVTRKFFFYENKSLKQNILGIYFPNPIGLAAGFDKNAELTQILPEVGFGFEEVGSITGEPCKGNDKPRLWRLPLSKSLVVYYGLKNDGCEIISERLRNKKFKIPIGISVAKTNSPVTVDTTAGIADYVKAYKVMLPIGDYTTINISCPNAFGGQPFTDPASLDLLLAEIDKIQTNKPVFIKLSPDLSKVQIDSILEILGRHKVQGIICTNLTKNRDNPKIIEQVVPQQGGLSGKVVEELSNELLAYIYSQTKGKYVLVGCGGVFTAEDAYKKIRLGASLIQMITGMIYEGPQVIGEINKGLVELLKRDGFDSISQAVGVDVKESIRQL